MHTVQEIKEMVAEYRKAYPEMKAQVSIEALESLEAVHGPEVVDGLFDAIQKNFDSEIEVIELVRLGVPFADAVKQVYTQKDEPAAQV